MFNNRSTSIILVALFMVTCLQSLPVPAVGLDFGPNTSLFAMNVTFNGRMDRDNAGMSVAIVGDVNGDGYDDILIGAPGDDEGGNNTGQSYLFFGKQSGWVMFENLSNADASFWGEADNDCSGGAVAGAGDVNGDGYDDFIIGVKDNDEYGDRAGQTYLIFGKPSGWAMGTNLASSNASFLGESAFEFSGVSVAGAGDVNGDGYDDFLIGAEGYGSIHFYGGRTYLILGSASGWEMNTPLTNASASLEADVSLAFSGHSVAGAGDVNGDGLDDILIGAYNESFQAGTTYLVLGNTSGWELGMHLTNATASFKGEDGGDISGISVAGAGDLNGDGYDDILIGAAADADTFLGGGKVYVIFGNASGWAMNTSLADAPASYHSEGPSYGFGWSVAGAGDVNGDGYDDFVVGAITYFVWGGKAYLFLGRPSGWSVEMNASTADASFKSDIKFARAGWSVSESGDVNGDGYDDILIGAYNSWHVNLFGGEAHLAFPDSNSRPSSITSVKAYDGAGYSNEMTLANINDTAFIELRGSDGNASRRDIAIVNVTSSVSSPMGMQLRLMETGVNTGIYQGNLTISNRTHEPHRFINASEAEKVTISSVQDPTKNAVIVIGVPLYPSTDHAYLQEDVPYVSHFWVQSLSPDIVWSHSSNATWLQWNATTHNISGTPRNDQVGSYWANVSISVWSVTLDHVNLTITVNNTPPEINATIIDETPEDIPYRIDFNSSDDGQGTTTWHLSTDAGPWLAMNSLTGVLNGTPGNDEVGTYRINVSVDDGNGGWGWSNYTLDVKNVNDDPVINTTDNLTAYEDDPYSVQYRANDVDAGSVLKWTITTNATGWLKTNPSSGLIYGTPRNEHVGTYWVNVSVKDNKLAEDFHYFILTVKNTNDIPVITSEPTTNALVDREYTYTIEATDEDVGDVLTLALDKRPEGMALDAATGMVNWTPTKEQEGVHQVVVNVSDGNASVFKVFNITAKVPANYPPIAHLISPANGATVELVTPVLRWGVEDPDSDELVYNVYLGTSEMDVTLTKSSVRAAQAVTATEFIPSAPLSKGVTYFWTVIPDDGISKGTCTSGTWRFKIGDSALEDHKPMIVSLPGKTAVVGETYVYNVTAKDEDIGDVLVFSLDTRPDGMDINGAKGIVTWVPLEGQIGTHPVGIRVSDGILSSAQTYEIKVLPPPPVNNKPSILMVPDRDLIVGEAFEHQVVASDKDAGDVLVYSLTKAPAGMAISSTGLLTWMPTSEQTGSHLVTLTVSDGKDNVTVTFTINVKGDSSKPADSIRMEWYLLEAIATILILCLVLAVFMKMRKKKA